MSLGLLGEILSVGAIAAAVGFGGYHYQYVHLPAFKVAEAETSYTRCMRECCEVCKANGIAKDDCVCDNCDKYLRVD